MTKRDLLDAVWESASFGTLVSTLRSSDGISMVKLSSKLSIPLDELEQIEADQKEVTYRKVIDLAEALGYPVEPFLEVYVRSQFKKEGLNLKIEITRS